MNDLTHLNDAGEAHMVDVGGKTATKRIAIASAVIQMERATVKAIEADQIAKGDVLQIARIAGLMAAKQTANLIPLCHPVGLDTVSLQFTLSGDAVHVRGMASVHGKTGVEMEAMTAVSVAALTIYDMCKAIDRGMRITCVQLEEKSGGKSGSFMRKDPTS